MVLFCGIFYFLAVYYKGMVFDMKKQLIVTLSFLIVSVSVLGVASYAWYSNNTVVSASGMNVSVVMPINIMASTDPDTPAAITSLAGFGTNFSFGSTTTEDGITTIIEYDMLIPVSSSDGRCFAYLPFRYVDEGGYPREGTQLENYQIIREPQNAGYFIDIPLYLTTTTARDLEVYVSQINLSGYTGEGMITGAVRCAVIVREEGEEGYREVIAARSVNAAPLLSPHDGVLRPLLPVMDASGELTGFSYSADDTALWESAYYAEHTDEDNPYALSQNNKIPLKSSGSTGGVITYYTTEARIRIWLEGTDESAVKESEGKYFALSVVFAVNEE